jgi:hypothetical protein
MKNHFGCPAQATANVLAGKWKPSHRGHNETDGRSGALTSPWVPGAHLTF